VCSLLLLQANRDGEGEWKIFAIYWVNLCLPAQWLRIPFMLQYRCINYDYRKHQFFCMLFSRLCGKMKGRNERRKIEWERQKGFFFSHGKGKSKKGKL
jgi:hypothetical protein